MGQLHSQPVRHHWQGWVDTAATGSIDLTTVAAPVAVNTSSGYKVYRMADTLQATAPIFVKFEFGSGAAATTPSMWVTVGTTHDGLGNLGNILLARVQNAGSSRRNRRCSHRQRRHQPLCFCFCTTWRQYERADVVLH
jgi:hypothetical protein